MQAAARTSAVPGIYFAKVSGRWRAQLNLGHQQKRDIGTFDTEDQAIAALDAAKVLHEASASSQ
jgi:hypothetical protein